MIDTIAITLQEGQFKILDASLFEKNYSWGYMKLIQNPSKQDSINNQYRPKVTVTTRYGTTSCYIEFSAPKLIFGNNFEEVQDGDFDLIISVMQKKLLEMSVEVDIKTLINAKISKVHYSKNLNITDYATCNAVLKTIAKADISRRLDAVKTDYRNDGQVIRYHTNGYELSFYDKLKDAETAVKVSEKRSIEQDVIISKDDLASLASEQILRMEFRFNKPVIIKDVFQKVGINAEPTFNKVFSQEISKTICLHYWEFVFAGISQVILGGEQSDDKIFNNLVKNGYTNVQAAQLIYPIKIANKDGMRALRNISETLYNKVKEVKLSQEELQKSYLFNVFRKIQTALHAFEPIKIPSLNNNF